MKVRQLTLKLQIESLQALIEDRKPQFETFLAQGHEDLVNRQITVYDSELLAHQNERRTINQQIVQKRAELTRNKNQVQSIQKEIALLQEQVKIRKQLSKQGLVARTELLVTQSKLLESMRKKRDLEDSSIAAETAINEKIRHRAEMISGFLRDKQSESGQLLNQLAEVDQEIIRLKDRVDRLELTSPVDGIVQALTVTSINAVVNPSEVIMRLVPVDDELIVEAKLSPSDIGYIHTNLPADVKVDSYDPSRFGSVSGTVKHISATTYLDDQRNPYYRAEIKLDKPYVGNNPQRFQIIPRYDSTSRY